ncbi:PAS domain-containing protein [Solitalea lacus]|uniref:PAS domain-containing protein n=1 Tax=Solitalea lacus TaxID=2911172 RepID=UPI001EDC2523|nr:PAS domain-containing protein [Solitalea lacus]UKJ05795.1 PAS domain-containing protein [Solitalea lacus]
MLNRYNARTVLGTPLNSWDVFMEGYFRLSSKLKDVTALKKFACEHKWQHDFDFETELCKHNRCVIIADTGLNIVFVSRNITAINGYLPDELIGKPLNLFQGIKIDPNIKSLTQDAISMVEPFKAIIVNYRKNRTKYNCEINGFAVFNKQKELVNLVVFKKII